MLNSVSETEFSDARQIAACLNQLGSQFDMPREQIADPEAAPGKVSPQDASSAQDSVTECLERQSRAIQALTELLHRTQDVIIERTMEIIDIRMTALEDRLLGTQDSIEDFSAELGISEVESSVASQPELDVHAASESKNDARAESSHGDDSWETIRNSLLQQEAGTEEPSTATAQAFEMPPETRVEDTASISLEAEAQSFHLPQPVDIDLVSEEELRQAVIERDELVATLLNRLRHHGVSSAILSEEQLRHLCENFPDELKARVENSLNHVDQQLRIGELELSLERARVGRQLARLEESREKLEKNAKQLGMTVSDDGLLEGEIDPKKAAKARSGRRWLAAMGFGD